MADEMKDSTTEQQPMAQPTQSVQQPPHESNKTWMWILGILVIALLVWWLGSMYGWWGMKENTITPSTQSTTSTSTSSTTGGAGAGSSTPSTSITATSSLVELYAALKTGLTETEVTNLADGLGATCVTVAATASSAAQKACTYLDGGNVVVVTYQNEKVLSITKSGF